MWGKIVPKSIEKEPLEKLGSKTIYEKYDSKGAPPGISDAKESTYNAGDPGSIPGLGRSPGEENGYPHSLDWEDPLEKRMATHSMFLLEEFHGQRSLVGYSPRSCKELDITERLTLSFFSHDSKEYRGMRLKAGEVILLV